MRLSEPLAASLTVILAGRGSHFGVFLFCPPPDMYTACTVEQLKPPLLNPPRVVKGTEPCVGRQGHSPLRHLRMFVMLLLLNADKRRRF